MVEGCKVAGITAGASTPDHIINEFAERLAAMEV
jgi:4-hydroxy-3-methylbut-2-enyl diphosphate reductase IspH